MPRHVFTHLTADHAVGESHDVGVGPRALGPRLDVLEVVREVHGVELVVHELPDVPREVIVAAEKKEREGDFNGTESFQLFVGATNQWRRFRQKFFGRKRPRPRPSQTKGGWKW